MLTVGEQVTGNNGKPSVITLVCYNVYFSTHTVTLPNIVHEKN